MDKAYLSKETDSLRERVAAVERDKERAYEKIAQLKKTRDEMVEKLVR